MEDTLQDAILMFSFNLLMSVPQLYAFIQKMERWKNIYGFVFELKPSKTQLSLMGLDVLVVFGEVSWLATFDLTKKRSTCQLALL